MSQISLSPQTAASFGTLAYAMSQDTPATSLPTTAASQEFIKKEHPLESSASPRTTHQTLSGEANSPTQAPVVVSGHSMSYTSTLLRSKNYSLDQIIDILKMCEPDDMLDYTEHVFKIASLLHEGKITNEQALALRKKLTSLTELLPKFVNTDDPADSMLYLLVERCFDLFVKIATSQGNMEVSTLTIRFLTSVMMNLNYWEVYNLLQWKPAIYQFLMLIQFDLSECYARFIKGYLKYSYRQTQLPEDAVNRAAELQNKKRRVQDVSQGSSPEPEGSDEKGPLYYMNKELSEDHDKFVSEQLAQSPYDQRPIPRERRKIRVDSKLAAHRVIKRADLKANTAPRSANYDPDVIHECQLPSQEETGKVCMRRFSRKYELIRHQETVHSKKKKLFKCFVCVKQDPTIGPRIFTRHDTLAKHIRVNHKISGKEAKAEVAYSKKHAEIVEEGDITVHVGRRKTKVDFELRAHMERKGNAREAPDGSIIFDDVFDSPEYDSGEDQEAYEGDDA